MTLLIAYSPTPEGTAALESGRAFAARLSTSVVVFDLGRTSQAADRIVEAPEPPQVDEVWLAPAHTAPAPVDDLLDTANELDVEAIVVGLRRRSPVGKLLLGSQAQRIILDAAVPVLTVKVAGS